MPSSVRLTVSSGMKWRELSSIRPRQGKRGRSRTTTSGTRNAADEPVSTSCRNVSMPRSTPHGSAAWSTAPSGPTRERVALVHPEVRERTSRRVAPDLEGRLLRDRDGRGQDEPRLPRQPRLEPPRRAIDDRPALSQHGDPESRPDHQLARSPLDRGRPRHEGGPLAASRRGRRQGQHRDSQSHRRPPAHVASPLGQRLAGWRGREPVTPGIVQTSPLKKPGLVSML